MVDRLKYLVKPLGDFHLGAVLDVDRLLPCCITQDDGIGFSMVPWKPMIEQRLGPQLAATAHGSGVSWEIGRQRAPSI